jgi:Mn-containing catalase
MFMHNKKLMYTVRVNEPNPTLATFMLEQFGGPQGELAAAMRYFTQGISETDAARKDLLMDIATEELSHLEIIGSIIVMLCKGIKGRLAEGADTGELFLDLSKGGDERLHALSYGSGAALINSGGAPWTAAYVDSIGDPSADLRSNIAAEARAKIVYERLINCTPDAGVRDALGFLMTREIAHQKSFEKALYSLEPNFPPGKLPGNPEYTDKYFNMSDGDGDERGPWNDGPNWDYVEDPQAEIEANVSDSPCVKLSAKDEALLKQLKERTKSRTDIDPLTGAELGAGPGAGKVKKFKMTEP